MCINFNVGVLYASKWHHYLPVLPIVLFSVKSYISFHLIILGMVSQELYITYYNQSFN